MQFKTKAKTLSSIENKIKTAVIPKYYYFKVKNYLANKKKFLSYIQKKFKKKVAIRSSTIVEDSKTQSMAGYFLSELNVSPNNMKNLQNKIDKVIKSYSNYNNPNNEILVQEMITDVFISGVATTADKETLLPYYCIDYSGSQDTSKVTAGTENTNSFVYFAPSKNKKIKKHFIKIIKMLEELKKICKNNYLDIEFILGKNNKIFLLQVRPLVTKKKVNYSEKEILLYLYRLYLKIEKLQLRHHNLLGNTTAFGVMPDWNPAEMIGIKPKPLELSLYQELITDHVWSLQRKSYGYRDLTSHHLLTSFFGTPYIDIRVDFNSWIPEKLPKKIAEKLVNYYINRYKKNLHLHDKIEFNIIFTCLTFNTKERLKILKKNGFTRSEIKIIIQNLRDVTHKSYLEFYKSKKNLDLLVKKSQEVINSKIYLIDKIYWLIEDCKKYGTYTFAGSARCAFIAVDILNSIRDLNIISESEKESFLNSIKTIASKISEDFKNLSKNPFLNKHGHLRPNTYDITSLNYKEGYNLYFNKKHLLKKNNTKQFNLSKKQLSQISKKLKKEKINISVDNLIKFIKESISHREYSKYLFTKNVSLVLDLIKTLAEKNNISRKDIAFLNINTILNMYYNLTHEKVEDIFNKEIEKNKKNFNFNSIIKLPDNILNSSDAYGFETYTVKSNFITSKNIVGKIVIFDRNKIPNCKDKIVLIENADPGYDFIFTKNIKGLITKYGGANSHMAIRCSELNIPAAIGVGEKNFSKYKSASSIRLNCNSKNIVFV
tara:strand:+ start:758 stop:3070 length:2313 start_codon:yes stop_codon:yes gene_type:complete